MDLNTHNQILSPGIGKETKIMIIGAGSGGSNVALHLARMGFCRLTLVDFDVLEIRNCYLHACGIEYVGQKKVLAVKDLIKKWNPNCEVKAIDEDVFTGEEWKKEASESDIVVLGTDNDESKNYLNDFCIEHKKPFVAGKTFRKAIGGEIYRYIPGKTGCLSCLKLFLESGRQEGIHEEEVMSDEEKETLYSQNIRTIKETPGLYIDTQFIPLLHARMVLDTALQLHGNKTFPSIRANYVVWSNHCVPPLKKSLGIEKYLLNPQNTCRSCNGGAK